MRFALLLVTLSLTLSACDVTQVAGPEAPDRRVDRDAVLLNDAAGKRGGGGGSSPAVVRVDVKTFLPGSPIADTPPAGYGDEDVFPVDFPSSTFFGCPDTTRPCNEITIWMTGVQPNDLVYRKLAHAPQHDDCSSAFEGDMCVFDETLANNFRARLAPMRASFPVYGSEMSVDDSDGSLYFTFHWQGQRMRRRYIERTEEYDISYDEWFFAPGQFAGNRWMLFLDVVPGNQKGGSSFYAIRPECGSGDPPCWAEYDGGEAAEAFITVDAIQLAEESRSSSGRGKKTTTSTTPARVSFEIQAFDWDVDPTPDYGSVQSNNLPVYANIVVTAPDGSRDLAAFYSLGVPHDGPKADIIWTSGFRISLDSGPGCYGFEIIGAHISDDLDLSQSRMASHAWKGSVRTELETGPIVRSAAFLAVSLANDGALSVGCTP